MKKKILAVGCVLSLLFTGCGNGFPDLTDAEAEVIGEYAAIALLKYDANSRSRLVDLSQIEEAEQSEEVLESQPEQKPEEAKPEETTPEEKPQESESVQDPLANGSESQEMMADSMESFWELPEGVNVSYAGYDLVKSYQGENSYFTLDASEGKTLLVLRFVMQNNSGAKQEIDLLGRRDNYRITVNESYTRTALTTMLANDLSTFMGSLEAGASEEVVLLIEVDSEIVGNLNSINLNLKNESKTYTIRLL